MVRRIGMVAGATVYRAVITKQYAGREPFTSYEGPYDSAGAARARVTNAVNWLTGYGDGSSAYGHVESGTVVWTKFGE